MHHKGNRLSRREFIGSCTACVAGVSTLSALTGPVFGKPAALQQDQQSKTKISLIFAHPSSEGPIWPNIGYDFESRKKELLTNFQAECPGIDFQPVTAMKDEDAPKILEKHNDVDGYIVYLVGCLWGNVPETIAASGKPTVFVDDLYAGSGKFLTGYAKARREGFKVIGISSSRFQDIVDAVRCIDTLKKLRSTAMLVIGGNPDKAIEEQFGTKVLGIEFKELNDAYQRVPNSEAGKRADRWINDAAKVIEPTRDEIKKSAAMYIAMKEIMGRHNAHAIAINCLGGYYGGHIFAYPCLGFMQLDDEGLVGACEADQRSTITKLLMTYLTGRPGFISDPVIDTATNQIIYAHCVAPTKVYGPEGTSNPYHIRSHSEDRQGACNRSLMPLGEITTTLEFDARKKQVIFHQGKTVANVDEDMACRNKLAVEVVGDVFKLLNYWDQWGWHRVTFYGDFKRQVYNISTLLGFEVVEEA